MENEHKHITDYKVYAWILVILLVLTTLTITVTWIHLSALTVLIALLIATIKAGTVLTYFMHLKFEIPLFRLLVTGVLLLYVIIIVITFFDYLLR